MFPIINPFEAAATWNAAMSQIFDATVQMQVGANMMMLEAIYTAIQGPPPEYAVSGKIIFSQALTPRRFAEVTAG